MSIRAIGSIALLFFSFQIFSQVAKDTIREQIDYRNKPTFESGDGLRSTNHYVGVQANQLLRQLFNLSGNNNTATNNPYTLTYSFNSQSGNGMAFGLGQLSQTTNSENQGQKVETKSKDFFFRIGYEKKTKIGPRWILGCGVDVLILDFRRDTKTSQNNFTTEFNNKSNGWGCGPRASLLFHINSKVYLGTETTWYYQAIKTKTENIFSGNPPQNSDSKDSSFSLQIPVAIFLILKF